MDQREILHEVNKVALLGRRRAMAGALPVLPDWDALEAVYGGGGLYHGNATFDDVVRGGAGGLAYLATPYTDAAQRPGGGWCPIRSDIAGDEAARWQVWLTRHGVTSVSPVVMATAMLRADMGRVLDPLDRMAWLRWGGPLLAACNLVVVPRLAGWQTSRGIWAEVTHALRRAKAVYVVGALPVGAVTPAPEAVMA